MTNPGRPNGIAKILERKWQESQRRREILAGLKLEEGATRKERWAACMSWKDRDKFSPKASQTTAGPLILISPVRSILDL